MTDLDFIDNMKIIIVLFVKFFLHQCISKKQIE